MKRIQLIFITLLLCAYSVQGQHNIVPHWDFEGLHPIPLDPNQNTNTWANQSSFGGYPWLAIHDGNSSWAPQLFSADNNLDQANFGVPTNHFGTQNPVGDISTNRAYVGLTCGIFRRDGIMIQLTEPLKQGFSYHLTFWAAKKSSNDVKLEFKFGKTDSWVAADCPNCNSHEETIEENGGDNNDEWQFVDFAFTPEECDLDWIFIRTKNMTLGDGKVLIDNISIINSCTYACSPHYGDMVNVFSNNAHWDENPLTFFSLDNVNYFDLKIYPLTGGGPIRTITLFNPAPILSWDGKDDNGNEVANGSYSYKLFLGNNCACRSMESVFEKGAVIPMFNVTSGNYLNALTLYNLDNVNELTWEIQDINGNVVRTIGPLYNPPNTIAWDGRDNNGVNVTFGTYHWFLTVKNLCGSLPYEGTFGYNVHPDLNDPLLAPLFDYTPIPKPYIDCPYSFDYSEHSRPPKECCALQPHLSIQNQNIAGRWDYILLQTISAGPSVAVKAGSDVLFQAGTQISLLPGFTVEPGTEFDAIIAGCTPGGRMANPDLPVTSCASKQTTATRKAPEKKEAELIVYPNPSAGVFTLSATENSISKVCVVDLFGKVVREYSKPGSEVMNLDISEQPKGIYIVKVEQLDGKVRMKKVIYQ
jgi:hypothetical protein